ncbi:DUF4912 domain-containing protein [Prochlorococcus marinus XMU1408]|uniref:DUF4912 domain-containing protein n=2 Tax=Prochlorococcus marinus TaxID=1219 RepID=A0A318R5Q5_PROMR|nr:DUF4912 domain-containing protein [Prochlorococcus marinus str. XMU1408]PYE03703.1 DUF4912 domain-containing protein [Prochlorococcus marinus XMU1408]
MKTGFQQDVKEYFWNKIKKVTNSFSNLAVNNLGDGYVKCFWDISFIDNFRIEFSKSCFYAIRLYDITNNRDKNNSTCIMKEIQVSKYQSSVLAPIPINKGVYYFEFGFRKRNGDWRKIADQQLNLGFRIIKVFQSFENDNWFNSSINTRKYNNLTPHEEAYQLSFKAPIGGSDEISEYR